MARKIPYEQVSEVVSEITANGAPPEVVDKFLSNNGWDRKSYDAAAPQPEPQKTVPGQVPEGATPDTGNVFSHTADALQAAGDFIYDKGGFVGSNVARGVIGLGGAVGDTYELARGLAKDYAGTEWEERNTDPNKGMVWPTSEELETFGEDVATAAGKNAGLLGEGERAELRDNKNLQEKIVGGLIQGGTAGGIAGLGRSALTKAPSVIGKMAGAGAAAGTGAVAGAEGGKALGLDPRLTGIAGGLAGGMAARGINKFTQKPGGDKAIQEASKRLQKAGVTSQNASQVRGSDHFAKQEGLIDSPEGVNRLQTNIREQSHQMNAAVIKRAYTPKTDSVKQFYRDLDKTETPITEVSRIRDGTGNIIGRYFQSKRNVTPVAADAPNLAKSFRKFAQSYPDQQDVPIPRDLMNFARSLSQRDTLTGTNLKGMRDTWMQRMRDADASDNTGLKNLYSDAIDAVDRLVDRGSSPKQLAAVNDARGAYRHMLFLEESLSRQGSMDGNFNPSALQSAYGAFFSKHQKAKMAADKNSVLGLANDFKMIQKLKPKVNKENPPSISRSALTGIGTGAAIGSMPGAVTLNPALGAVGGAAGAAVGGAMGAGAHMKNMLMRNLPGTKFGQNIAAGRNVAANALNHMTPDTRLGAYGAGLQQGVNQGEKRKRK